MLTVEEFCVLLLKYPGITLHTLLVLQLARPQHDIVVYSIATSSSLLILPPFPTSLVSFSTLQKQCLYIIAHWLQAFRVLAGMVCSI